MLEPVMNINLNKLQKKKKKKKAIKLSHVNCCFVKEGT